MKRKIPLSYFARASLCNKEARMILSLLMKALASCALMDGKEDTHRHGMKASWILLSDLRAMDYM